MGNSNATKLSEFTLYTNDIISVGVKGILIHAPEKVYEKGLGHVNTGKRLVYYYKFACDIDNELKEFFDTLLNEKIIIYFHNGTIYGIDDPTSLQREVMHKSIKDDKGSKFLIPEKT